MTDCLFCRIVAGEIPSRVIYSDDTAIAFLDIAPYHRGHSLVIPRRHIESGTMDPASWNEVAEGITTVSTLLKEKLGATGVNILSNAGAVAGQEIFHFHVHILPRYPSNPGMGALAQRDDGADDDLDGLFTQIMG
ncbi:MAG: HIT domain-containing protein [Propionibacteriaceae bacterium]|jgi:histidine triad (HIT) family protein|nr:HIT domain-containing protein [Propionibacteriaceae bacterium]